jgi:hypothetical protein
MNLNTVGKLNNNGTFNNPSTTVIRWNWGERVRITYRDTGKTCEIIASHIKP